MIVARTIDSLRQSIATLPRPLALVPTMGALHAGHVALVAAGLRDARSAVASIFVNPLQFAGSEDLSRYPRDEAGDFRALESAGCALVWAPTVEVMYAGGVQTTIEVGGPSEGFEGAARPGHFRGMATVVGKLLHQVEPDLVMFGEKDWQQVQVVRRMVDDLNWPVRVVPVPTVREADGLAMSSRNRFLTAEHRQRAPLLHDILKGTATKLLAGDQAALLHGRAALGAAGFEVDYLELVDPRTLVVKSRAPGRLLAAARLGSVRLLDNVAVGEC